MAKAQSSDGALAFVQEGKKLGSSIDPDRNPGSRHALGYSPGDGVSHKASIEGQKQEEIAYQIACLGLVLGRVLILGGSGYPPKQSKRLLGSTALTRNGIVAVECLLQVSGMGSGAKGPGFGAPLGV